MWVNILKHMWGWCFQEYLLMQTKVLSNNQTATALSNVDDKHTISTLLSIITEMISSIFPTKVRIYNSQCETEKNLKLKKNTVNILQMHYTPDTTLLK